MQKQYGFVDVGTKEMGEYCKAVLSGVELYGRQLTIQDSRAEMEYGVFTQKILRVAFTKPSNYINEYTDVPLEQKVDETSKLQDKLRLALERFGAISGCVLHDGYALYSFDDNSVTQKAADALNNQFFCGFLVTTIVINR